MNPQDFTYADLLERNACLHSARPALTGTFGSISHAQLQVLVQRLAGALAACGVQRGDRVAVLAHNRPEIVELLGATARLGAILVLLSVRASAAETAFVIADIGPRLLVAEPALEPLLADLPETTRAGMLCHGFEGGSERLRGWAELVSLEHDGETTRAAAADPLLAIPTAAVDGRPRAALLSHASVIAQALQLAQVWSLGPGDVHLCGLPLFHMAGLGTTLAAQMVGGSSVLMPRFDPGNAVLAIEQSRVTFFATFSPMLGSVLDAAAAAGATLNSVRVATGLEAPDTVQRFEDRCPHARFWSAYGQTETGGPVTLMPACERPGAAGRPMPLVALGIEDEHGQLLPSGRVGEIVVRGPSVFSGYWQRVDDTSYTARGGWHHTGDLGRLDEDGTLWFTGRAPAKELIKTGGENVYPAEVELALLAHPAVAAAVVFGVPDPRWGEAVRAVCVRRPQHNVSVDELIDFVAARIARFKRPRDVVFVERVPTRPDGTTDRDAVKQVHTELGAVARTA